jgi:hypothetical protein
MKPTLIFVYNAESGFFNTLSDAAHKIFSPQTYACRLCSLTHSSLGMRGEWKQFVEGLSRPVEFLHADEFARKYGARGAALPAVFTVDEGGLKELVGESEINACGRLDELKRLILERAL